MKKCGILVTHNRTNLNTKFEIYSTKKGNPQLVYQSKECDLGHDEIVDLGSYLSDGESFYVNSHCSNGIDSSSCELLYSASSTDLIQCVVRGDYNEAKVEIQ